MYFDYSSDNKLVQQSVNSMFKKHLSIEMVRGFMKDLTMLQDVRKMIAQQGLLGIIDTTVKEEKGIETAVVVSQEVGRFLLPLPYLENLVGLNVLRKTRYDTEIIGSIESGDKVLTVAWEDTEAQVVQEDEGFIANGILKEVPFAGDSDFILAKISFRGKGETPVGEKTLVLINVHDSNVKVRKVEVLDETYPLYEVYLNDYEMNEKSIVHEIGVGNELFEEMFNLGALLVTAEMIGCSERVLDETVEYTKQRKQFDVEIGKFQAVKHLSAEMYLKLESSRVALQYATWCIENNPTESARAISIAKSYVSDAAVEITRSSIQIHGGIGFTWESDMHLYFKRVQRGSSLFGDAYFHREKMAENL